MSNIHRYSTVRYDMFVNRVKDGDIVLDLGAGYMGWGQYMLDQRKDRQPMLVCALDFSETAKCLTQEVIPVIDYKIGNVLHTPYENETFDMVGAGELIEHMDRPDELVKEMARITQPEGWMVVCTVDPECEDSIRNKCTYPEHLWQFTPDDLIDLLVVYGNTRYFRVGNYDFVECKKV